jgi:hypothetical protein
MDRVISSYAPTVRALRYSREPLPTQAPESALVVAMPTTPGMSDLRHVVDEANNFRRSPTPSVESVDGTATTAMVLGQIERCAVAHSRATVSATLRILLKADCCSVIIGRTL